MNWPSVSVLAGEAPAYYKGYLLRVPEGDLVAHLQKQLVQIRDAFGMIPAEKQRMGYAEGKWSPLEMLGHLLDVERIFQYRVLTIARGDESAIPGMDEDEYVIQGKFNLRNMGDLLDEFAVVRNSTILLLKSLEASDLARIGNANGKPVSARAVAAMLYGHPDHHLQVLRERY